MGGVSIFKWTQPFNCWGGWCLPPQNSSSGHVPELLEDGESHGDFIWADLEEVVMSNTHPSLLEKHSTVYTMDLSYIILSYYHLHWTWENNNRWMFLGSRKPAPENHENQHQKMPAKNRNNIEWLQRSLLSLPAISIKVDCWMVRWFNVVFVTVASWYLHFSSWTWNRWGLRYGGWKAWWVRLVGEKRWKVCCCCFFVQ